MDLLQTTYDAAHVSKASFVALTISLVIVYQLGTVIYNLYFHPLRHYPGPILCCASPLPWAILHTKGLLPLKIQKWHDQYGHVVRISPNHLSFTDARAWKEIYGHRAATGSEEFEKCQSIVNSIECLPLNIINENREGHQRLRRALSHGFSDSAIKSQEPIILKHVNKLVHGLQQKAVSADGSNQRLNMEAWMNWTTFDVVGELVFGTTFDSLSNFEYHPWVLLIIRSMKESSTVAALHYLGVGWVNSVLYKSVGSPGLKNVIGCTDEMLKHRLENDPECQDLFEGLVKKQAEWGMTFERLSSNALLLIAAGSETTATLLSGCIYLLLSHPEKLAKSEVEVRSAYKSDGEITLNNVHQLTFMLAVLNEALRLYPPVAGSLTRIVPAGGVKIIDNFVPGGTLVECQPWSMNHSAQNWEAPWEFRPERFIDKSGRDVMESLQPFSVGPRNCLGRNLAYAEMRFILARLLFNFDMRLDDSSKLWIERQRTYPLWERIPLGVYLKPR